MERKIFILIVIGIVLMSTCKGMKTEDRNINVIEIDLDKSKKISFTEWFDSIQIVPLETNDQSLIGNIDKAIFNDDLIYIFDWKLKSVLIFDNNGKFIKNTSHLRGQGPNEYIHIEQFDIDDLTGNLLILNPPSILLIYDADLELTNKYDMSNNLWPVMGFKFISNDIILFQNSNRDDDELINVFSIKENKVIKKICPIVNGGDAKRMVVTKHNFFYKSNNQLCFIAKFSHNQVFVFDSLKIDFTPKIEFKVKQNQFHTANLLKNQDDSHYRNIRHSDNYSFIIDINETERCYFSSILYRKNLYFNKYDKETGKNQVVKSQFLEGGTLNLPLAIDNNIFYYITEASYISFFLQDFFLEDKYRKIIENISEDDNPYIIKYFIKK